MGRIVLALILFGGSIILGVIVGALRKKLSGPRAQYQKYSPVPSKVDISKSDSRTFFTSPWALWIFTAQSCMTCPGVVKLARQLESEEVSIHEFPIEEDEDIHRLYAIDSVPLTLIINETGVVERWFFGPLNLAEVKAHIYKSEL